MKDDTFDDDYLWDRTGGPDEELARLERLLARYRLRDPLPPLAADGAVVRGYDDDGE